MKAEHVKEFLLIHTEEENNFAIDFTNEIESIEIIVNEELAITIIDEKIISMVEFVKEDKKKGEEEKEDVWLRFYYLIDTSYIVSIHIA